VNAVSVPSLRSTIAPILAHPATQGVALLMETTWTMLLRLLIAAGLGAMVGFERQLRRRPAGMRTGLFICMGACLFTILSEVLAHAWGDTSPTRIAANLVQGIGFLGAGAIMRDKGNVVGLTTASVIFVLAAIGMGVAGGLYMLCTLTALFMLLILFTLGWFEDAIGLKTRLMLFRFHTPDLGLATVHLHNSLESLKVQMQRFQVLHLGDGFTIEFEASVSASQQRNIVASLSSEQDQCEVVSREESVARD
jgi:putative Mg2+ transporter-C (MgtC) family protein